MKAIYVGRKAPREKDWVMLYCLTEKNEEIYHGKIAKEFKFVKKELIPADIAEGDIIDIDLEENDFGKVDVVDINIIKKGGK